MSYRRTKYACYFAYLAMSSVFCLPPMLFVTFRQTYHISYTLLGTLVLTNFCTQLLVDLLFTVWAHKFSVKTVVRIMPLVTATGLTVYALSPCLFPNNVYVGLLIGTVIFSVASGLCEVLLSPLVASLPSDDPGRDMSTLHSLYAYGVLSVVLISSLFFVLFGSQNWQYLALFWAVVPIFSCLFFCLSPIPDTNLTHTDPQTKPTHRKRGLLLCVGCIFLGSAAENSMTNWISGYLETALGISKSVGDILGLALFAILLGLGRTLYAKYGKNISKILLLGMTGAVLCYLVAGLSTGVILPLIACVLTGLCTSMLWPGTLIFMEEKIPHAGVAAYALMAAGGDLGASVAPQLLGSVVDWVSVSSWATTLGNTLSMTPEQVGMKVGMLLAAAFPLMGILLLLYMKNFFKKEHKS
ncbi:MAG: MFS transporter [Clostridia bacterium]|nr:MFS transporter [Clostridia bacterium]